jgi:hypothetical protein
MNAAKPESAVRAEPHRMDTTMIFRREWLLEDGLKLPELGLLPPSARDAELFLGDTLPSEILAWSVTGIWIVVNVVNEDRIVIGPLLLVGMGGMTWVIVSVTGMDAEPEGDVNVVVMTLVCATPPSLSSGNESTFGGFITTVFTPIMVSTISDFEVRMFDEEMGTTIGMVVIPSDEIVILVVRKGGNINDTEARTATPVSAGLSGMGAVTSWGCLNGPVRVVASVGELGSERVMKRPVVLDTGGTSVTVLAIDKWEEADEWRRSDGDFNCRAVAAEKFSCLWKRRVVNGLQISFCNCNAETVKKNSQGSIYTKILRKSFSTYAVEKLLNNVPKCKPGGHDGLEVWSREWASEITLEEAERLCLAIQRYWLGFISIKMSGSLTSFKAWRCMAAIRELIVAGITYSFQRDCLLTSLHHHCITVIGRMLWYRPRGRFNLMFLT